ncbi:hypothetical protein B1H19_00200 [Streptomyces gilvosporeus]|uniref:Uncharacterized protein n=1 Tax=Streptomyces gilvosporeus TaxID=553510 RepID=A0A1V0TJJ3_9ACTN|nr:hypothetical protein B1H19_00200 [Streptomyces gilvosporeus]
MALPRQAIDRSLMQQLRSARPMRRPKVARRPTGRGIIRGMVSITARPPRPTLPDAALACPRRARRGQEGNSSCLGCRCPIRLLSGEEPHASPFNGPLRGPGHRPRTRAHRLRRKGRGREVRRSEGEWGEE